MTVVELVDPDERTRACGALLRLRCPNGSGSWRRSSRTSARSANLPTFAVREDADVAGLLALKLHNEWSAEILVVAVRREQHGRGLGRRLVMVKRLGRCR